MLQTPPKRRVSAIVPTKNRSHQLREALASIRALEGADLEFELIVVDNGSTDDSLDVAHEFGARVLQIATPGAAAARNAGLEVASADYVAFLDDDDAWLPGHIRPHLDLLQARPELSAVVGQIVLTDNDLCHPGEPYPIRMSDDGDLFTAFLGQIPQLGAVVARASVRETVGYFDPSCEGDEDWDWHLRLALRHQVGFVPVACMLFRQRPIGVGADLQWHRVRNTRRVFFTNLSRAGRRAPGAIAAARMFLKHNGYYYAYFAAHADELFAAGNRKEAFVALRRAVLSSPLHGLLHLARRFSSHLQPGGTMNMGISAQ